MTAPLALGIDIGGTSIKLALLQGDQSAPHAAATAQSPRYSRPGFDELASALRSALAHLPLRVAPSGVGLCAPGLRDPSTGIVLKAVNLPALVGRRLDELLSAATDTSGWPAARVVSDAHAAAVDFWTVCPAPGRLLAISLGTGVGACVLDDGEPLVVSGTGPGHLGQVDVGLWEGGEGTQRPVGPDGGSGSLEAYMGLPALRARYGEGLVQAVTSGRVDRPPLRALVQAIRIAHAMYRPQRIALLGGVGLALAERVDDLHAAASLGLTSLARPGWTLEPGRSVWHAAIGAARLGVALAKGTDRD